MFTPDDGASKDVGVMTNATNTMNVKHFMQATGLRCIQETNSRQSTSKPLLFIKEQLADQDLIGGTLLNSPLPLHGGCNTLNLELFPYRVMARREVTLVVAQQKEGTV